MAGSLGIGVDSTGMGLSALDHRILLNYLWTNTGIIGGLNVSGRSDLAYDVSEGAAICSRSTADGKTETVWRGGKTSNVAAGDSANPRIDCIYIIARNRNELNDSTNQTQIGVVQGTPAANPVPPSPPAGALAIAYMRMPAQATSTSKATRVGDTTYAIPYGGRLKDFAYVRRTDAVTIKGYTERVILSANVMIPTDRTIEVKVYATLSSAGGDAKKSEVMARIRVDGKQLGPMQNDWFNGSWKTWAPSWQLELGAGQHKIELVMGNGDGDAAVSHGSDQWTGIIMSVHDGGVQV